MATDYLQIPDITASQNQKEVTANAAHNLLDRAMNQIVQVAVVSGSNALTTTQSRENGLIEITGTPGAAWTLNMPDTNQRVLMVYNNSDDQGTIRNSASGGSSQPVIEVGEATIFHYDGTDFIDISSAAITASTFVALTDTPGSFSGQGGQMTQVNAAESALEFIMQTMKRPVVAATTAVGTLSTDFENGDTLDGVTLATGDRILIKNQASSVENGVYIVQVSGSPVRAEDFDDNVDVQGGVMVPVQTGGTSNGDTIWVLQDDDTVVVDTDNLIFVQFGSVATFLGLSDTPSAYTNGYGSELRVNSAESAITLQPRPWKDPVIAATDGPGTLSTDYENGDTLDGVTLTTGDRILIKDQASASENGIYVVASTGSPTRAEDCDEAADFLRGFVVGVDQGTTNANTLWQLASTVATVGSDDVDFASCGGGSVSNLPIIVALSDETTAITGTGTKFTMRAPFAFTLNDVRASLTTASDSGDIVVDINEGGSTVLSTKITVEVNETTSLDATTPPVISDPDIADDAILTFDVDSAGSNATGLKVTMIVTPV